MWDSSCCKIWKMSSYAALKEMKQNQKKHMQGSDEQFVWDKDLNETLQCFCEASKLKPFASVWGRSSNPWVLAGKKATLWGVNKCTSKNHRLCLSREGDEPKRGMNGLAFEPQPLKNSQIKSRVRHHLPDVEHRSRKNVKRRENLTWEHAVTQTELPLFFFFFFF